jgi:hypothetical protein
MKKTSFRRKKKTKIRFYINKIEPINTNTECPVIPVHDIDNNQEHE